MKKKILMVEYQGRCDTSGVAVGHAPKVLSEYAGFLKDDFEVSVLSPRCVLEATDADGRRNAKVLPRQIVMKGKVPIYERIFNKFKMFRNIRTALSVEADVYWFFNVEFYLMLYLALFGNRGRKIVCTMFMSGWHGGLIASIKQKIFERAQKRISYFISTGPSFSYKNVKASFLPDYYCDEAYYAKYRAKDRKGFVCLGTMGAEKQLEEMVERFTELELPLTVAGRFYDKERLEKLKALAGSNVEFRDEYLTKDEYLKLLGKAKYVVLPYAPLQYGSQTSGVLQEALFLDTVCVTHRDVLEGNRIPGIGYGSWDELKEEDIVEDTSEYLAAFARLRREVYSREHMKAELPRLFSM